MPSLPTSQDSDPILDSLNALLSDTPETAREQDTCCPDWITGTTIIADAAGSYVTASFAFCPWCGKARPKP